MKKTFIILLFSSLFFAARAQRAADSLQVIRAANDYIEGFYNGDTAKIYYSIDSTASKHGYSKRGEEYRKVPMSFAQMLQYARNEKNRPSEANARIRAVSILDLQSKIAAVKVRAWWGIDYLLLTKMGGKWVIKKCCGNLYKIV